MSVLSGLRVVLGLVVLDQKLHRVVSVVLVLLGMGLRDVSFRDFLNLLVRTVTFPFVLEKS